ncbi:MAG: alpha-L-rhamnosidase N-terminal domain-containing protein [Lewinella sp.]
MCTEGPIRYGSFFQGEVYDASLESTIAGWAAPDFDDEKWKPAVDVPRSYPDIALRNCYFIIVGHTLI